MSQAFEENCHLPCYFISGVLWQNLASVYEGKLFLIQVLGMGRTISAQTLTVSSLQCWLWSLASSPGTAGICSTPSCSTPSALWERGWWQCRTRHLQERWLQAPRTKLLSCRMGCELSASCSLEAGASHHHQLLSLCASNMVPFSYQAQPQDYSATHIFENVPQQAWHEFN